MKEWILYFCAGVLVAAALVIAVNGGRFPNLSFSSKVAASVDYDQAMKDAVYTFQHGNERAYQAFLNAEAAYDTQALDQLRREHLEVATFEKARRAIEKAKAQPRSVR